MLTHFHKHGYACSTLAGSDIVRNVMSRNFRKFAEQQAARLALVELMGRRLGEGLDKFALAVIDSIMPGSELERRAVQRLFKGASLQSVHVLPYVFVIL
eukprot:1064913-Amorphochlora_amoeboformis.AAC.1